ncbi:hypothetical protein BH18ACI5_BH18ACI5_23330 [soil metagenome]
MRPPSQGWPPHGIRASLAAPLVPPLLYWLVGVVRGLTSGQATDVFRASEAGTILAFGGIMSFVAAIFIGLPGVGALAYAAELTRTRTLAIGVVAGLAVAQVMQSAQGGALMPVWFPHWFGAVAGGASAATWWELGNR